MRESLAKGKATENSTGELTDTQDGTGTGTVKTTGAKHSTQGKTSREAHRPATNFSITFGTFKFDVSHEEPYHQSRHGFLSGTFLPQSPLMPARAAKKTIRPSLPHHPEPEVNWEKGESSKTQKFVKISPATNKWQQAFNRKKQSKNPIKCFNCLTEGHIQKNCRKETKCYSCDQTGHKYRECPFKSKKSSFTTQKKNSTANSKTPSDKSVPAMEPILGRPSIGDFYCPPNQTLSEENSYLCKVGMVILIRGNPSQNLARLIASKMAEIHGGRQEEYIVSEATIAPYVITCPNM